MKTDIAVQRRETLVTFDVLEASVRF